MQANSGSIIALASSIREQANEFIIEALAGRGVTDVLPAHGMVLNALFQRGPLQMSALAKAIGRKKNTVTSLINTLAERGYCRREQDPQDARAQFVALTDKGEALRAVQDEISAELLELVWRNIDESEMEACVTTLKSILHNLKAQE